MEYGYLDKEVKALVSERDRLAAENAELNAAHAQLVIDYEQVFDDLTESDATLDRLREIIPKHLTPGRAHRLYVNDVIRAAIVLYPPETTNDDR